MRCHLPILLFLILPTLLGSCIKEEIGPEKPRYPTRTVLVYLAGDNNLSELSLVTEKLRQSWSYNGNRCLIYYDAADAPPRLLSLRGGCSTYPEPFVETLATYDEENSASREVFARVVRDAAERCPADSYGLLYISHSTGWLPVGTLQNPNLTPEGRSVGYDRNVGLSGGAPEMELQEFADAIEDGHFDFIVFETCLMGGVEVAYALREKTRYLLVSSAELLIPGFLPVYGKAFPMLMNTSVSVEESLKGAAAAYYEYIDRLPDPYRSTTLSIIDTRYLESLADRVGEVYRISHIVPDLNLLQHFDRPGSYGDIPASPRYFDFMECMGRLATEEQYNALKGLMEKVVVWKASTPHFLRWEKDGFPIEHHCGLTTYVEQDVFPRLNASYRETAWYRDTRESARQNK